MWHLRQCGSGWGRRPGAAGLGVVLLVLAWGGPAFAGRFPPDPVEDLRQALKQDQGVTGGAAGLKYRKETLQKYADRLTSLGDLGRAMLLRDWRYHDLDLDVAAGDLDVWTSIARRFKAETQKALHSRDPDRAAAAATLLGEMATAVQGAGIRTEEVERAVAEFVSDLKDLSESDNAALRTTALRTMGKLGLQAQGVLPLLRHALETDGVPQRRAAAESLFDLIRLAAEREKEGATSMGAPPAQEKPSTRPEPLPNAPRPGPVPGATPGALPSDQKPIPSGGFTTHPRTLLEMSARVVPIGALALRDPDAEVRRLGTEAIHQAAQNLTDSILLPVSQENLPPAGRALSAEDRDTVLRARSEVQEEWRLLTPLMDALKAAGPALAGAARDPDPAVRLGALRALEQTGYSREKLMRRWYVMPPEPKPAESPKDKDKDKDKERSEVSADSAPMVLVRMQQPAPAHTPENVMPADPLRSGLDAALPSLIEGLASRNVPTRLAAVDALEMLGELALPAVPALTRALGDPNLFVRWAAARTLGKMVPEADREVPGPLVAAVPALARLLSDEDLDLRVAVATALGRFGSAGRAAVPALAWAATNGDAEGRIAAIEALGGIGTDSAPAIPAVVQDLSDPDARLRLAACRLLGRFGPDARAAAAGPLRTLTNDPDADVRRAASDALLSILRP